MPSTATSDDKFSFSPRSVALSGSIDRALSFLQRSQRPTGEFTTMLATDPDFSHATFDSSPFVTSHVLQAIHGIEHPAVAEMARQGLGFLRKEENPGGLWRYYSRFGWKHFRIPPDLDDTACVSHVLKLYGGFLAPNRWIFFRNRDSDGRFFTWIEPKPTEGFLSPIRLLRKFGDWFVRRDVPEKPDYFNGVERFVLETDAVPLDDVDPVVNANVICYLGDCPETKAAAGWLAEVLASGGEEGFSLYYRNPLALSYAVARAIDAGAISLAVFEDTLLERTKARASSDGSFGGPLSTAFAANVLLTLSGESHTRERVIGKLLDQQAEDGSWDVEVFYSGPSEFWGSRELTTAIALRALVKFERRNYAEK